MANSIIGTLPNQIPLCGMLGKLAFQDNTGAIVRSSRTGNTMITVTDIGTFIDITSGTFTQTFDAASVLGNGWWIWLRNSGTGDITLDPNSSETIDGLTSYIMYPNEVRFVQCNGTTFTTFVAHSFYRIWTTTATNNFTKPPGYNYFEGLAWGGGSSGGRAGSGSASAAGGGGGGSFPFKLEASAMSATETITIGAGGAAITTAATYGNLGGTSSIGNYIFVNGGGNYNSNANYGGSVTTGNSTGGYSINTGNGVGFEGIGTTTPSGNGTVYGGNCGRLDTTSSTATKSVYGGGSGGSVHSDNTITSAGVSLRGGSGGAASLASNGTAGSIPGGGGGATQTGTQSGAGARGEVRMWGVV